MTRNPAGNDPAVARDAANGDRAPAAAPRPASWPDRIPGGLAGSWCAAVAVALGVLLLPAHVGSYAFFDAHGREFISELRVVPSEEALRWSPEVWAADDTIAWDGGRPGGLE